VRHVACQHLQSHGHKDADECFKTIKRDHAAMALRRALHKSPVVAEMLQDPMTDRMVKEVLKELNLPDDLKVKHFLDKTWGMKLGPDKINIKLSAGMATELNAELGEPALRCIAKDVISGQRSQDQVIQAMQLQSTVNNASNTPSMDDLKALAESIDMKSVNKCLVDNAELSAMIDATADATVSFFDIKLNVIRAQLTAAANLFPFPIPQGDEPWYEAMKDNYRVDLSLSIMDICIPIYKGGRLVKDFSLKTIDDSIHLKEDSEGQWSHGSDGDSSTELIQEASRARNDMTSGNSKDLFNPAQGQKGVPSECSKVAAYDAGFLKEVWGKAWNLGSLSFPIVPGMLNIGVSFYAELGLKIGYNFGPCGSLFDLQMYGAASAIPHAFASVEGSVFTGFAMFKAGIALNIPLVSANIHAITTVGAKLQSLGGLNGFMEVKVALDPWVFRVVMFMEMQINLKFKKFTRRSEFELYKVTVPGFDWTLYKGDFMVSMPSNSDTIAPEASLTSVGSQARLASSDSTPPSGVQNYAVATKINKIPYASAGKGNLVRCNMGEDCRSGVCVKVGSSDTVCRPTSGFALGSSCFYSRDCDRSKGEFCRDAGHPDAKCAALSRDMDPCENNAECASGTCALQHGLSCVFRDKNCACRPKPGFPSGTQATSILDCASRSTKMGTGHLKALSVCS